jgi:hypothetical protein
MMDCDCGFFTGNRGECVCNKRYGMVKMDDDGRIKGRIEAEIEFCEDEIWSAGVILCDDRFVLTSEVKRYLREQFSASVDYVRSLLEELDLYLVADSLVVEDVECDEWNG